MQVLWNGTLLVKREGGKRSRVSVVRPARGRVWQLCIIAWYQWPVFLVDLLGRLSFWFLSGCVVLASMGGWGVPLVGVG